MAYRFHVNEVTCINCGICMDLCPVRCLDMTRPTRKVSLRSSRSGRRRSQGLMASAGG